MSAPEAPARSSDGTPATPTPMLRPTLAGIATGVATSWLSTKLPPGLVTPDQSAMLAGALIAGAVSGYHKLAQHLHWS